MVVVAVDCVSLIEAAAPSLFQVANSFHISIVPGMSGSENNCPPWSRLHLQVANQVRKCIQGGLSVEH